MPGKIKYFFVQYQASILSLIAYYCWWLLLLLFNKKEYDNNVAGGMAIVGLALITIVFSISILAGLIITMINKKEQRLTYVLFIIILSFPVILLLTLK